MRLAGPEQVISKMLGPPHMAKEPEACQLSCCCLLLPHLAFAAATNPALFFLRKGHELHTAWNRPIPRTLLLQGVFPLQIKPFFRPKSKVE